jgi:hypothetical protein
MYEKTIIYKLFCKDDDVKEIYIGSTVNFRTRKIHHKYRCNNEKDNAHNLYVYRFIRNHGGWKNWDMVPIEKYSCNDKTEKLIRERYWIESLNSKLNTDIPGRTREEYNREYNKEYQKEYRVVNKDKIRERCSEKIICDCGREIRRDHKTRHVKTKIHLDLTSGSDSNSVY